MKTAIINIGQIEAGDIQATLTSGDAMENLSSKRGKNRANTRV